MFKRIYTGKGVSLLIPAGDHSWGWDKCVWKDFMSFGLGKCGRAESSEGTTGRIRIWKEEVRKWGTKGKNFCGKWGEVSLGRCAELELRMWAGVVTGAMYM